MTTTLTVHKSAGFFVCDDTSRPGSPPIGSGRTLNDAIATWVINNQVHLGIEFDTTAVQKTIQRRRATELRKR